MMIRLTKPAKIIKIILFAKGFIVKEQKTKLKIPLITIHFTTKWTFLFKLVYNILLDSLLLASNPLVPQLKSSIRQNAYITNICI